MPRKKFAISEDAYDDPPPDPADGGISSQEMSSWKPPFGFQFQYGPEHVIWGDNPQVLGQGAFGSVYLATLQKEGCEDLLTAVKKIRLEGDIARKNSTLNEVNGLAAASGSPHLVQMYTPPWQSDDKVFFFLAIEFCGKGDLAKLKKHIGGEIIPTKILAAVALSMTHGLAFLAQKKLLHRDIKPENVLISHTGQIKLTDFGISRNMDNTFAIAQTFVGTTCYLSPERAMGSDYNWQADVWSMGMVLFELAEQFPFPSTAFVELFEHLVNKPEPRLDIMRYSGRDDAEDYVDVAHFVEATLIRDANLRSDLDKLLGMPVMWKAGSCEDVLGWFVEIGY